LSSVRRDDQLDRQSWEPPGRKTGCLCAPTLAPCCPHHEVIMNGSSLSRLFSRLASTVSDLAGRPATFSLAAALVLVWAISGPLFGFSDSWQLVINTSTTIVTFLMVFIVQNSQNRDGKALQAKIDELILTSTAHNKFVGIEKLEEEEIREVSEALAEKAEQLEGIADEAGVSKT
jgi:low affinity Fe/Cu permease